MMKESSVLHTINIILHISAGSIALLLGLVAVIAKKGGKRHKQAGKLFLFLLSVVIFTGLVGVFVFGRNTFLLVITLLSAYQGFSGYRVLQTKSNRPMFTDIFSAFVTLLSAMYFMYYFKSIGMMWSPVIIYSTVGYLLFIILYDFLKYLIPVSKYKDTWMYEHIVKMIGSFSAITSAFTGTVFPNYQPYSQFLPSVAGMLLIFIFSIAYSIKRRPGNNKTNTKLDLAV